MTLITTNHKEASSFDVLPVGKYEVFIESGQPKTTSAGSPMINWKLNIRNDVEQVGGGRKLFTNLVIQENTMGMVQGFLKAVGSPEGAEYATAQDVINFATGRAVKVSVKIVQYQGDDKNEVGYFMESDVGGGSTAPSDDPFFAGAGSAPAPIEVDEDDLPF